MILTGICKEKFLEWISLNNLFTIEDREKYFNSLSELFQNALIIEFFDSVGIYIDIRIEFNDSFVLKTFDSYAEDDYVGNFSNRQEATIQAIKKANDLYISRYENV